MGERSLDGSNSIAAATKLGRVNNLKNPTKSSAHRLKMDGTFDSICLICFQTIGNADQQDELSTPEHNHVCAPGHLSSFGLKPKSN